MYLFKQKTNEDGVYNPYRKNSDTFWIVDELEYTKDELFQLECIPHVSIVIERDPGVSTRYFCHYEIKAGKLSLFKVLLPIFQKLDSMTVITPTKVRNLLLDNGIKEVNYNRK